MTASSTLSRRISELIGVVCFAVGLMCLVALVTYDPSDPAWYFNAGAPGVPSNLVGRVGAFFAELAFQLTGFAAYLVPAIFLTLGWKLFWCRAVDAAYTKLVGVVLLFGCLSSFFTLALGTVSVATHQFPAGGFLGDQLSGALLGQFNRTGSLIVITALLFLSAILATHFSFGRMFAAAGRWIVSAAMRGAAGLRAWRDARRRDRQRREVIAKHTQRHAQESEEAARPVKAIPPVGAPANGGKPAAPAQPVRPAVPAKLAATRPPESSWLPPKDKARDQKVLMAPPLVQPVTPPGLGRAPVERRRDGFVLPPLSLLDPPRTERKIDERALLESARLLEEKCREFAVDGTVVKIHPGPVVTTFEFKPDAGVKYSKVTGLADDLCLAMQAESVLIERLPGKSTVGIQIPNPDRDTISLRELLESDGYRRAGSKLTVALGKTIHGEPMMGDLALMPHLLIAGSTGTGKSVAMNAMLTSILYRATPEEVRLILIDPKRLELGMYEEIPHLLTPVVVEPKQASNALNWAVHEMEERYKTLAAEGVRNIDQYNRNVRHLLEDTARPKDEDEPRQLPYIVLVIDELADLMMVAGNEVEESICRLAQMARAVGIHLILATQRPSVDVITGLIKANLPARISFRVSSKVDSRTILDGNGAEQLLGRGDMLFLAPATARLVRLHGPYISEQETARLASYLRKQGKPVFNTTITQEAQSQEALEFEKDDLYDEAARIVVSSGQASISYLQRRLRIGFSRAARLVDMMEAEGLVSPAAGGKPRDVLVDKGYFDEVDSHPR